MFGSCLIFLLQSTIPEINIVFRLYILQFIRIIVVVEIHPSSGMYNSNPPVNITINNVDKYIFMCNTFLLCKANRPEWTDSEYWTRLSHVIEKGYQVNDNIVILGDSSSDFLIHL